VPPKVTRSTQDVVNVPIQAMSSEGRSHWFDTLDYVELLDCPPVDHVATGPVVRPPPARLARKFP
jgi:hypothetical protein